MNFISRSCTEASKGRGFDLHHIIGFKISVTTPYIHYGFGFLESFLRNVDFVAQCSTKTSKGRFLNVHYYLLVRPEDSKFVI